MRGHWPWRTRCISPSAWRARAQTLAVEVSTHFGGAFPSHAAVEQTARAVLKARGISFLPLSCLQSGLAPHRAVVFKACCDRLGLACELVRTRSSQHCKGP